MSFVRQQDGTKDGKGFGGLLVERSERDFPLEHEVPQRSLGRVVVGSDGRMEETRQVIGGAFAHLALDADEFCKVARMLDCECRQSPELRTV